MLRSFEADPFWAKNCLGYHIQARPSKSSLDALVDLQHRVAASSPVPLLLIPAASIHISVVTLISARGGTPDGHNKWSKICEAMACELEAIVRQPCSISITFQSLLWASQALIICTDEQPERISDLRYRFAALLNGLDYPAQTYDQTHITLARFAENAEVSEDEIIPLERSSLNFRAEFDELLFVRERQYPSLLIDRL